MNPLALILPAIIVLSGLIAFVLLPLDLPVRLAILGSDLLAAVGVGIVFARRHGSK